MEKRISGTKEWSTHSVNCVTGCEHDCRYCYARETAVRQKRATIEDWPVMKVRQHNVNQNRGKVEGRIMFPTTHDITPSVLVPCMMILDKMLKAGNEVLIVSKPHIEVIQVLCLAFAPHRDQILFRFTIGAVNQEVLNYWEPNAPEFLERLECLRYAFNADYKTSVSAEPLLDYENVDELVKLTLPHITDALWIGQMNKINRRVQVITSEDEAQVSAIEKHQTPEQIKALYERYKDEPKIRWKESIKEVVGLDLATEAGEDR